MNMQNVAKYLPAAYRGTTYFFLAFLPCLVDQLSDSLKDDSWPSGPRFVLAVLLGSVAGLSALRAFLDRTMSRIDGETTEPKP